MNRQRAIKRSVHPLQLEAFIDESALYQQLAGPDVMREQLRCLLDASQKSNVTVRIHPFSAGYPLGMANATFYILDFPEARSGEMQEPTLTFLETGWRTAYLNDPTVVDDYNRFADALRGESHSQSDTRQLIKTVIKRYER